MREKSKSVKQRRTKRKVRKRLAGVWMLNVVVLGFLSGEKKKENKKMVKKKKKEIFVK